MTEKRSKEELEREIVTSFTIFKTALGEMLSQGHKVSSINSLYSAFFYTPDRNIVARILEEIESHVSKLNPTQAESKQAGYKLEELTLAVFHGLKGWFSIKSYQSAGPQYDLLIAGNGAEWDSALSMLSLELSTGTSTIVVEAKATKGKVSDQQFARLCGLMETNLHVTSALGIFFTLNGASGFPTSNSKRKRTVGSSRLRQLLFYARTKRPIVVLDINDIRTLTENGSLLRILERKIRDIEELTGLPIFQEDVQEIDLPNHLENLRAELCQPS